MAKIEIDNKKMWESLIKSSTDLKNGGCLTLVTHIQTALKEQGFEFKDGKIVPVHDILKDSEDERIRKALKEYFINSFQNNGVAAICGVHIKYILAWLEKQGGQKPADKVEPKFHEGDVIKPKDGGHEPWKIMQVDISDKKYRFKDGYVIHFSQEDDYELVEQKPADLKTKAGNWYVCDMEVMNENMVTAFHRDEVYYCPKDGYIDVNGALFEVGTLYVFRLATEKEIPQPKQKPATWSEEDENLFKCAIDAVKQESKVRTDGCLDEEVGGMVIDWLKSLKERVLLQPKQEWSEEDERAINDIMWIIEAYRKNGFNETHIQIANDSETWLQSLEDRYTWKPSEEQLQALRWVCNRTFIAQEPQKESALEDLHEQLMAL